MDTDTLRALLVMHEGETLDFKGEPYQLATRPEKAELAKDIMAIANGLARGERGRILLGVREAEGRREVAGIAPSSHEDASLQEIVKRRISPPPRFSYSEVPIDDTLCGVIEIEGVGKRPYFPIVDSGPLQVNVPQVRHGSSTGVASPLQVIEWHAADNPEAARVHAMQIERLEAERRPVLVLTHHHVLTSKGQTRIRVTLENAGSCAVVLERGRLLIDDHEQVLPLGKWHVIQAGSVHDVDVALPTTSRSHAVAVFTVRSALYDVVEQFRCGLAED